MDKNNLREVLSYLSNAGVDFSTGHFLGGMMDLDINQVINYAENPNRFFANLLDVGIETIHQYESFRNENFQCTALTGKGKRCSRRADSVEDLTEFQYGITTLCVWHKKHFLKEREN